MACKSCWFTEKNPPEWAHARNPHNADGSKLKPRMKATIRKQVAAAMLERLGVDVERET
jgi:hypothetical protein